MYCWNCQTQNDERTRRCSYCGAELAPSIPPSMAGREIPNYLVHSILVTVFCFWPAGVVAIIFAAQVDSKLAQGDFQGALDSSKKAKLWCWISVGVILAIICIVFLSYIIFGANSGAGGPTAPTP